MKILRYTESVQKQLNSKTKPEPWLHVAISNGEFAIFVWDTRDTFECGNTRLADADIRGQRANDNKQPLKNCKCSPYFRDKFAGNQPEVAVVRNAEDFKQRLSRLHSLSPAEKRGITVFLKDMDAKYGRNGHGYRSMLHDAQLHQN